MPDTNDALQSSAVEVPDNWQEALGGATASETASPDDTPETQQAEEVKAPETQPESDEQESTQTDDSSEPTKDANWAFEWAEDGEQAVLAQHVEGDTLRLTPEVLDLIRQGGMRRRGFHQKMAEVAEERKENEQLIQEGREFRKLFTDLNAQRDFLAWQESRGKAPETDEKQGEVPSFETDEDLAKYVQEQIDRGIQRGLAERDAERSDKQKAQTEAQARLDENAAALLAGEYSDLTQDEFISALKSAGESLRDLGFDPQEVCLDEGRFAKALRPHADRIRLERRIQSKDKQREATKRAAERSESASSTPARRGESGFDLSTPEGRAQALMHEYAGKEITTTRAP